VRRIVIWLASTVTVVVLLFGYHTSTNATEPATAGTAPSPRTEPSGSSSSSSSSKASRSSGSSSTPSRSSSSPAPSSTTKTYTGDVAQTRWGPVQVRIAVAAGKITKVTVVQQPSGNPRDTEINDYALPILIQDTIDAQSAQIDMVSGATVTSDGYLQSLQSAIDQAGI
jgi:uncharacterized protein with FMN-binding domain